MARYVASCGGSSPMTLIGTPISVQVVSYVSRAVVLDLLLIIVEYRPDLIHNTYISSSPQPWATQLMKSILNGALLAYVSQGTVS
jgi:uncharacterized membrane protein YqaE (UPF0057 family)